MLNWFYIIIMFLKYICWLSSSVITFGTKSQCLESTFISNVNVFGRLLQASCRASNVIKVLCLYYKLIKTVCYAGPSFLRGVCNYVFTTGQSFVVCAELSETASKSICRSLSIWPSIYLSYRYALDLWGVFPGVTYRYKTFTQCWFIVAPTSQTLNQL